MFSVFWLPVIFSVAFFHSCFSYCILPWTRVRAQTTPEKFENGAVTLKTFFLHNRLVEFKNTTVWTSYFDFLCSHENAKPRKASFSCRISVDGKPNRNKAAFSPPYAVITSLLPYGELLKKTSLALLSFLTKLERCYLRIKKCFLLFSVSESCLWVDRRLWIMDQIQMPKCLFPLAMEG